MAQSNRPVSLPDAPPGRRVRIQNLQSSPEVSSRLREMGFREDAVVRLVTAGGNVICEICHSRYGLKREVADNIVVSVME